MVSRSAVWITSKWVVPSTMFMRGHYGPSQGAVAAPLIIATDLVGMRMTLLREKKETVTSSKSSACWVTVGLSSGVWGLCGIGADCDLGVVCVAHQGRDKAVGSVGGVVLLDAEGQGQRHKEVLEGLCAPL